MDKTLQKLYWSFVIFTLIPILIIFPLSLIQYFGDNSAVLATMSIVSLLPLVVYYYQSRQALLNNSEYNILLRITFYVNFLLYMLTILVAFYCLVIGGFLFTNQVPMGLELERWQAPYLLFAGFYLIAICALGISYLSKTKKIIST